MGCQLINRANGKQTVPSSMGLYPLQTHAVLANGIYFYNPAKHKPEPVVKDESRNLAGKQILWTLLLSIFFHCKSKIRN